MQKNSDNQKLASTAHRTVQRSTTLNRRYVKRPAPVAKKIMVCDDKEAEEPIITSANLEDAIQEVKDLGAKVVAPKKLETKAPKVSAIKISDAKETAEIEVSPKNVAEEISVSPKISRFKVDMTEEKVVEKKAEKKVEISLDLPPAPNPYQEAIDRRSGAREVKKAAEKAAEFYVGPTPEERKNAEIEKALKEVAKAEKPAVAQKELSARKSAAIARKAERAAKRATAASIKASMKAERRAAAEKVAAERELEKAVQVKKEKPEKKLSRQAKLAKENEKSVLQKNVSKSAPKTSGMALKHHRGGRGKRLVLAFTCSVACVVALGALVYKNIPDISVKVTAMQSGIEATYPSYVPRDFALSSVYVDDEAAVVMEFKGPADAKFTVSEAESSWDSNALLNNYVKKKWTADGYVAARENGITIYICESNAVWVNGGILYKISAQSGTLTKKQIKNIVTSI